MIERILPEEKNIPANEQACILKSQAVDEILIRLKMEEEKKLKAEKFKKVKKP
jgi:hypothetical protein